MKQVIVNVIWMFLLFSLIGFYFAVRPIRIVSTNSPRDYGVTYESVTFKTDDGIEIHGWFVPSKKTRAKTIILMHGYPADKGNIFDGTYYLRDKYNLLYFDFRYHGESGGHYTTVGKNEVLDLLAAIRYLQSRNINEVIVWGFSMGGAVALMTAPLTTHIQCVIAESSYARLDWVANNYYQIPLLQYPLAQLLRLWGMLFIGFDLREVSPVQSAEKITIPVLLIHSANDEVIPLMHAQALQQALKNNPNVETLIVKQLAHGQRTMEIDQAINSFMATYCAK